MHITVEPVSLKGKREDWIEISKAEMKEEKPGIKLKLKKNGEISVKSRFEFISAKFGTLKGQDAATLKAKLLISVVVEEERGIVEKTLGKGPRTLIAAELEAEFLILIVGSRLEVENIRLAWESSEIDRTIPKKDLGIVYGLVVSSQIPENLVKEIDPQLLLLLELLRKNTISI